ncbi:YitT family protein [Thermodesulfobacteriota bacterium]
MKNSNNHKLVKPVQVMWNLLLILVGSIICAIAVNSILIPQKFLGAGFTGVALLLHYFSNYLPVSVLYFILNLPFYILGWFYVGRRFFLYSIPGMVIFSAALHFINITFTINDKILAAISAGIIMGSGSGIILRSLGSAGGLDILSVILLKRFSVRLGSTVLAFNSLILIFGAISFSLEGALYTLIYIYVNSKVLDVVVMGLSQRKALMIISEKWEKIAHEIKSKIKRGVTVLDGRGGYSGNYVKVLYTVILMRELPRVKDIARDIDPGVFVVVSDTMEVMGNRIGNQPHW